MGDALTQRDDLINFPYFFLSKGCRVKSAPYVQCAAVHL
jgi:hypothetical protein